jgi:hypothetical protein
LVSRRNVRVVRELGQDCPRLAAAVRRRPSEGKKRVMGFEPTTFTLATCNMQMEQTPLPYVITLMPFACTNACIEIEAAQSSNDNVGHHMDSFADALLMIARLPLSGEERVAAIRKMLHMDNRF